jgi:PAS domain S-box-containing protein
MNRMDKRHLSFIPVPALIVIIVALYLIIKPSVFFEPAWLLPITNTVFVTMIFLIVAYIAMRNFKATGRVQILLLGCGVLTFGIGGEVAGWLRSIPGGGANLNVTIYNTGALIGAAFHFAAALLLLAGISPEVGSERKKFWLVFSYVGLTVLMALFTMASLLGAIPPFFIQGVGPTFLRQVVLGAATIFFVFSFLIFMGSYLRNREVFLYWYSSALALTAISLTAFFIQSSVGSPIGWTGRFSQYLGGIYFLFAVITALHSAQVRRTSFDNVLTASLSPEEEKFRALAENSPDVIDRFDREMKHIYINPAGVRLFGKQAGSLIGKTIEETGLPQPYYSLWKKRIQKVFETGQPTEVEDYIPTKNGVRFYQSHCVPEYGADGTVANVLVVARDLTGRKQAEEALRQSEQRYRSLFNGMTEGFALHEIICDEKGESCDYRFLEINPAFERLTGLKREDVVGKTMSQVLTNDDPKWVKIYGDVALTGKSIHFDNYSPVLKRHYEVFAYCPAPGQFGVLFMDITERKQAEEALRRSRDQLEMRVQERTEELRTINEDLKTENEERLKIEIELRESENHLRELSAALLSAQERERKRIAQEIHDSMGASLAATKFKVETALTEMGNDSPQTRAALQTIIPILQGTIEEARRIQMSLRPSILDDLGILATINWFCRQYESIYPSIRIEKEIDIQEHEVPDSLRIVIYRVLQEAMNNIAKHSKTPVVLLFLKRTDRAIQLVIQDSGQGFDLAEAQSRRDTPRGLGLDSMRERVELSGGSFSIESRKGAGTVIRAMWPSDG